MKLRGEYKLSLLGKLGITLCGVLFFLASCSSGSDDLVTDDKPEPYEVAGLDITDKTDVVSICYSMWFNNMYCPAYYNNTEILAANPDDPQWGPNTAFHYWVELACSHRNKNNII